MLGLGLIVIGWPLVWWAASTWRRPMSTLQLARVPAMCGDRLRGQIETTARAGGAAGFNLTLRCVRFEERADQEKQRVLWEETHVDSSPRRDERLAHNQFLSILPCRPTA